MHTLTKVSNERVINRYALSHSVADFEASQQQNMYDIQNPTYDVIEDRGEFNHRIIIIMSDHTYFQFQK